jgi:hypothetical protein
MAQAESVPGQDLEAANRALGLPRSPFFTEYTAGAQFLKRSRLTISRITSLVRSKIWCTARRAAPARSDDRVALMRPRRAAFSSILSQSGNDDAATCIRKTIVPRLLPHGGLPPQLHPC